MLQRQQASAIIDARKMIVDGAVGMVEMALERLNEKQLVNLDEEKSSYGFKSASGTLWQTMMHSRLLIQEVYINGRKKNRCLYACPRNYIMTLLPGRR